jgi:hypothetical protein
MSAPPCSFHPVERHLTIYKRLELDAEFRKRVLARIDHAVNVRIKTAHDVLIQHRARMVGAQNIPVALAVRLGVELDKYVWDTFELQRRIVEIVP